MTEQRKGDHVCWATESGVDQGEVLWVLTQDARDDESSYRRGAEEDDDPALLIKTEEGERVMKLASEVARV